jgi:hypothetical protein
MGRTRVPGGAAMVSRRVLLLFLPAGRDVRQTAGAQRVQGGTDVSFIATYRDDEPLDAVAGCEYVDDRIRLQE